MDDRHIATQSRTDRPAPPSAPVSARCVHRLNTAATPAPPRIAPSPPPHGPAVLLPSSLRRSVAPSLFPSATYWHKYKTVLTERTHLPLRMHNLHQSWTRAVIQFRNIA